MNPEYDVALSFAGEDRQYVEEVAHYLRHEEITVFYDGFEEDRLWGEDLYVHLDEVYRKASTFCVMFISKDYARKLWTNHERKSAQARDFINNNESFILPARFDDTEIKGLRPTIGFIPLQGKSPAEFARLVALKVRGRRAQLLSEALSVAIRLTEQYLMPQSLATSDPIAEEIRQAFRKTGYSADITLLQPFIEADSPAERVVGYIAYQTGPFMMVGNLLFSGLEKELRLAELRGETRPMWQLLVAVALFATITNAEEIQFLSFDLSQILDRLEGLPSVDIEGQCKSKIRGLLDIYPWMGGDRYNYSNKNEFSEVLWSFRWSNGRETYSLKQALAFVKGHPDLAQQHISQGHFQNWYTISIPVSATTLDLTFAIAEEMVRSVEKAFTSRGS